MFKNMWQEYRVFDDRVELATIFKTLVIPFEQVNRVAVANPYHGWWRLKLDLADFHKHVELDKATGLFRYLAITPDDAEMFRATLEAALTRFRDGTSGGAEMGDECGAASADGGR
jgi:hypothetical protein